MDSQPSPSRTRRRAISCVVLVLAPILGGAIGYLFAFLFFSGWFVAWQKIAPPPEPAAQILAINSENVWVQGASSAIYMNLSSTACKEDCWDRVDALPDPSQRGMDNQILAVKSQSCKPVPPFIGAGQVISECQTAQWWDLNSAYSLRADGSLYGWHYTSGGEYEPLG